MAEELSKNKTFLQSYYKDIRDYLESDIKALQECDASGKDTGCGPYLLTTCSGIDFLGTLSLRDAEGGLKGKSKKGFRHFLITFLGRVNPLYEVDDVADFIYQFARNGQVHEAIVKPRIMIGKNEAHHLKILSIVQNSDKPEDRQEIMYINTRKFADEFLQSLDYFEKLFDDHTNVEKMADRLLIHLEETHKEIVTKWESLKAKLSVIEIDDTTNLELYERGSMAPNYEPPATLSSSYWERLKR